MIDEHSLDQTGWARFSDNRKMRYRLRRLLTPRAIAPTELEMCSDPPAPICRVVFVMLNPSTADAFVLDPTVKRCCEWARRWEADVLEVVNLFALRSPYPRDLYAAARAVEPCGADDENDLSIIEAATGAQRVIAAWGNHGELQDRGVSVAGLLASRGIELEALRILPNGAPSHPLARGKSFIPYDVEPVRFAP